jgi:hypothetical protein
MTIRRGRSSDELWRERADELGGILALPEIAIMTDSAVATLLNRLAIPALGGGRWQAIQIRRTRARLEIDRKARGPDMRSFVAIRDELVALFGAAPAPLNDDILLAYVAWSAFAVEKFNQVYRPHARRSKFNRVHELVPVNHGIDAVTFREYRRRLALLAGALDLLRIASDVFGHAAKKSRAEEILEIGADIEAELAASMKPAAVTADKSGIA